MASRRICIAFASLAFGVAACSGIDGDDRFIAKKTAQSVRVAQAVVPVRTVDAIALMDWAQTVYPDLFPSNPPDQTDGPYIYRYYAASGNYLGVAGDAIYVLGAVSGGALRYVGTLADFSCEVYPQNCAAAVEVQPAAATIAVNATRQFSATVTGSSSTAVVWSVSCAGTACGSITSTGLYRAPAGAPVQVTVKAALASDASKSASASVAVVPSANARLNGSYAIVYQGFWNGRLGQCSGRFVADGAGNVTGGIQDCTSPNYPGGLVLGLPYAGSYRVFDDGRGELVFVLAGGGAVTSRFALTADGSRGFVQSFYSASVINAGEFRRQDVGALNVAAINGDYAFRLVGAGDGERGAAAIGRFHADGAGRITSGTIDINNGAVVQQRLAFTGTYAVGAGGRGTMRFDIANAGARNFAVHVVAHDRLILSSIDAPAPGTLVLAGEALAQTGGPYSARSLRGTGAFHLSGRAAALEPAVAVGLLSSDGVAKVTGLVDQNSRGAIVAAAPFAAGYAIGADGRGTIGAAAAPAYIFYVVAPNRALLMNAQPAFDPVLAGALEPQRPGPFSTASLLGDYATGTVAPPSPLSVTVTAITRIDSSGLITVPQDWTSPLGLTADVIGQGSFTMAANGRAVINPVGGGSAVMYVISPTRFVEIMTAVPATPPEDKTLLFLGEP